MRVPTEARSAQEPGVDALNATGHRLNDDLLTDFGTRPLLVLCGFSFASGLFFFGSMKLMSFHWITASVLISFLLVGMPVGGCLAVRYFPTSSRALRTGLWVQALTMLLTLGALPWFFDPGTNLAGFFGDTLQQGRTSFVLEKFLRLSLLFLPYFVSFGLNEFAAYGLAIPSFRGRSERPYALFLGATSLAYVGVEYGAPVLGVVPAMLLGIAAVTALGAQMSRGRPRAVLVLAATAVLIAAATPGLDDRYIRAIEHDGPMDSGARKNARALYRGWGRYCHLSVLEISDKAIVGFYNGGLHWFHRSGPTRGKLERKTFHMLPFASLPPNGRVLIIGAGGGEQVRNALFLDPAKVVAVEVIPEVLEVLGGPLNHRVSGVYTDHRVTPVPMDGRRYLDRVDEKFDLIYLPTVDTDISMMRTLFNSAETLYTVESFRAMRAHLTRDGVVVIQRPAFFDFTGQLLRQYFRGLQQAGLRTVAWVRNPAALGREAPRALDVGTFDHGRVYLLFAFRADGVGRLPDDAVQDLQQKGFVRVDDFGAGDYQPKTDDFLFRSDILFTMDAPLGAPAWIASLLFLLTATAVLFYLRRLPRASQDPEDLPFSLMVLLGVLVGVNFLFVEQFFVYKLYRILDRPMDAMFLGTVGFLVVTGAGGVALTTSSRWFGAVLALALGAALALGTRWVVPESVPGVLLALPLFATTGALFPTLFRGGPNVLLTVFVADALGAAVAGVSAFGWPIFFGFRSYDRLTLVGFAVTALAVWLARLRYGVRAHG